MPNNFRTRAFGPPAWAVIHIFAMGYPTTNPTATQKREYKKFFMSFAYTLPCSLCRESYIKFIKKKPLTNKILSGRRPLVYWTFDIHNLVNKKLNEEVIPKSEYPDLFDYYNQFSASGCSKKKKGCIKAKSTNKKPMRIVLITEVDKKAIRRKSR